ncbi:MAG: hypothetical protein IT375_01080 [Polyangiaceae bacterium]|nr:hypothetical protein [Polyangiaceae bacterium]MCK6533307.1 hypothetical protein [Polyangiaceae bacterium]
MSSARVLRSSAVGLLLVVLGIAGLTARAVREGERQMRESDLAFNRNDLPGALVHARAAAVMYAPGAPHVGRGYERMVAIAVGAEAAGQKRVAEAAWRSVRGAALETRHAWVPHRAELARADENLARLAQAPEGVESADPKLALARAKSALARDDSPSTPFMVVLVVGFVLALGGLGLVGFMGVTAEGKLALGRAKLGLALSLLGAALWTFAVYRA